MNLDRLYHILAETTGQFRKGKDVEHEHVGHLDVTHVYDMPHESGLRPDVDRVDVVFVTVGVDKKKAEFYRAELIAILDDYPDPTRLARGPSYIEVGAAIGDQGAAFQLFALGQVLGLWTVITPATLGITDAAEARKLAGVGFVMISGFRRSESATRRTGAVDPVGERVTE